MRASLAACGSLLILLVACDSLPTRPKAEAVAPVVVPVLAPPAESAPEVVPEVASAEPPAALPQAVVPDAVYILESDALPPEAEPSLRTIAQRMQASRDLLIRVDSYAPADGSREMSLSRARQAAVRVKRRLVELGVPSYRILQAPFGAEHPREPRLEKRRVELFLLPLPR
jgi:outer membrane protein OmpA-like peptidoglycan-associated protein